MAELTEKSELANLYTKLTGITANLDELIDECETQAEKGELFAHILWQLKRGTCLPVENGGEYAAGFKEFVTGLATELNIPETGDVDSDGDVDKDDEKMAGDVTMASTIVVETDDTPDTTNNASE